MRFTKEATGTHQVGPSDPLHLETQWYDWGYKHTLIAQPYEDDADEPDDYRVVVRLCRLNEIPADPIATADRVGDYLQGDSNYSFDEPFRKLTVGVGLSSSVNVIAVPNSEGRIAALDIGPLRVKNRGMAAMYGSAILNQFSAYLAVLYDVPLQEVAMVVLRSNNAVAQSTHRIAFPTVTVSEAPSFSVPSALTPLFAMYADGIKSESPFYSFLSFFKIADHLLSVIYPRISALRASLGLDRSLPVGSLPEEPFKYVAAEAVGKKFTRIRDEFNKPFRVEVAHFTENSILRSEDPGAIEAAAQASLVMRYIANECLQVAVNEARGLVECGLSRERIEDGYRGFPAGEPEA